MKPRTIRLYFREAFHSIISNKFMSIASIFTVTACIFIVSVFFVVGSHVSFFVNHLGDSLGLVVFINDDMSAWEKHLLEERVRAIPNVTQVVYISPEEALYSMRQQHGGDPIFLRGLDNNNPFPSAFALEVADVAYQEQVAIQLNQLAQYGVADVRQDLELGRMLTTFADIVRIVSIALILALGAVAVVVITNTIHITVNARSAKITIMKDLGATDWFIRWPFIIEGILIGLIGSAIPAFITWATHDRVIAAMAGVQEISFIIFLPRYIIFAQLFPLALGLGTLVGLIGSGVSVRRHLKV